MSGPLTRGGITSATPSYTDVGFMGETISGSAAVSVQFDGILVDS